MQRFATCRRQAHPKGRGIAGAKNDTINAEGLAVGLYDQLGIFQPHKGGVVYARLNQLFGKFRTYPWPRRIIVNTRVCNAKTVFPDCFIKCGLKLCTRLECHSKAEWADHIPPTAVRFKSTGQKIQCGHTRVHRRCAQIGVGCGGHCLI